MDDDITVKLAKTSDELREAAALKISESDRYMAISDELLEHVISISDELLEHVISKTVASFQREEYDVLIARNGNQTVGYALGRKSHEGYFSVAVYVAKVYCRGKQTGADIGMRLMHSQIDLAREKDISIVWTTLSEKELRTNIDHYNGFRKNHVRSGGDSLVVQLQL